MPLRLIPAIHRATHTIGLYLEQLQELGVTQAEAHILSHLADAGPSSVSELHAAFAHRRSTLTSILDRLVARRLVTREIGEHDRRTFIVSLTRSGRPLAARVSRALERLEKRALHRSSKASLQRILTVLAAVETAATSAKIGGKRPKRGRERR